GLAIQLAEPFGFRILKTTKSVAESAAGADHLESRSARVDYRAHHPASQIRSISNGCEPRRRMPRLTHARRRAFGARGVAHLATGRTGHGRPRDFSDGDGNRARQVADNAERRLRPDPL